MAAKIIEGSEPAAVAELALFHQPATQVSVKRSFYDECSSMAPLESNDVISFKISGSPHYIDLSQTWLKVTVAIVKEDGSELPAKTPKSVKEKDDKGVIQTVQKQEQPWVATVNLPLWSLFKSLNVFFGTKQVCSLDNFNYLMYMLSVINYGQEGKNGVLKMAGYQGEKMGDLMFKTKHGAAFQKRVARFAKSNKVELKGRLMGGVFNIKRYLPPLMDITLDFHQSSDKFFILNYDERDNIVAVRRKLIDAKLLVRKVAVLDSVDLSLESKNRDDVFIYPYRNDFIRTLYITPGSTEAPFHTITTKHLPLRMVCALINAHAYNGAIDHNPYSFESHNAATFYLKAGDMVVPYNGAAEKFDFNNDRYTEVYHRFCDFVSKDSYDGPTIDYESFAMHSCFFCFDLSPTSPAHRQLHRQGTTQVYIRFDQPLREGIQLISLIETQEQLDIDFERSITQEPTE